MKGLILIILITFITSPGLAQDGMNSPDHAYQTDNFSNKNNFQDGQTTLGPWKLVCETKKFPNRAIAKNHLQNKQFEIQNCYAEQTVHNNIHEKPITATLRITPARIFFETKNIIDRHKYAKLIIGKEQKQFSLYTNCYNKSDMITCLLFPEGTNTNKAIVREMKNNNQFIIRLIDSETHRPVSLTFDLSHFIEIYPVIKDIYRTMEEILQKYSESFVLTEQWIG